MTILSGIDFYWNELAHPLYAVLGSLLRARGWDATVALGAAWDLYYEGPEIRAEEYYVPIRAGSVAEAVCPHAGMTSTWWTESDSERAWQRVRAMVERGHPAVVAVDNFYLPFRPAYGDVHTDHLIIVYGFDESAGIAYVLDAAPPAYRGPLPLKALAAARGSDNPAVGPRDFFYAGHPLRCKTLSVTFPEQQPTPDRAWIADVLRHNLRQLTATDVHGDRLSGLTGLSRLPALFEGLDPRTEGERVHFDRLYVFASAMMSQRVHHAAFQRAAARTTGEQTLAGVANALDQITHQWCALRILTSREARQVPTLAGKRVAARLHRIVDAEAAAVARLSAVVGR